MDKLAEEPLGGIYLLGHSEGTVIAPQVFAARPGVRGLILLCPFVQNIEAQLLRVV